MKTYRVDLNVTATALVRATSMRDAHARAQVLSRLVLLAPLSPVQRQSLAPNIKLLEELKVHHPRSVNGVRVVPPQKLEWIKW